MKTAAHQRYKTSTGEACVGVTTVIGKIAKPHLITWANRLGLDGQDVNKYVDALADIGTLIHAMVEADVKNEKMDFSDYSKNQIDTANKSFAKWLDWKSRNKFELIGSELQVINDDLKVGGTLDIYAKVNDKFTVVDLKTSKAVYLEQKTQAVAYSKLLTLNSKPVDEVRIIRIGRSESEGFEDCVVGGAELHWKRFLVYLEAYWVDKALEKNQA